MPDYSFEQQAIYNGHKIICGIDEAGRGPWAGPVTAAAVVLDPALLTPELLGRLDDSKKINVAKRLAIFEEIDDINILQATFLAMRRAVEALPIAVDYALVDGNKLPGLKCPVKAIVKGDGRSLSIATASIIAKVSRDIVMGELAQQFPGYGWERNAGYGTREHQAALSTLGVTSAHRKSYAPIRKIWGQGMD